MDQSFPTGLLRTPMRNSGVNKASRSGPLEQLNKVQLNSINFPIPIKLDSQSSYTQADEAILSVHYFKLRSGLPELTQTHLAAP